MRNETGVSISCATLNRRLHKLDFRSRIPAVKLLYVRNLVVSNSAKRERNELISNGAKMLFSDASKFCISFCDQGSRVWRMSEKHVIQAASTAIKFPQSVMVLGAMYVSCVVLIQQPNLQCIRMFWMTSWFLQLTFWRSRFVSARSSILSQRNSLKKVLQQRYRYARPACWQSRFKPNWKYMGNCSKETAQISTNNKAQLKLVIQEWTWRLSAIFIRFCVAIKLFIFWNCYLIMLYQFSFFVSVIKRALYHWIISLQLCTVKI